MDAPYSGREQTLAKHFILRRYLQTLAFKLLGGGLPVLTYVDGFSGPWESKAADYSDTSFMIAIGVLKDAHQRFREKGTPKEIRCFFVEENAAAYRQLEAAVMAHHDPANDFHVVTFCGKFEDAVPQIMRFVGRSFALTFIDPTGWTGYPYNKIAPILKHQPGEILVNFMYDYVNRFIGSNDPKIIATFDPILGGPNWKDRLDTNLPRGRAVEKLFREELKKIGCFKYVLSTCIEKSTADRPHFAIAYGTRSPEGLKAFRQVEYDALKDHGKRRVEAKQERQEARTGQCSLFGANDLPVSNSIDEIVTTNRADALSWAKKFVQAEVKSVKFSKLCACLLERFMLRETDIKDLCVEMAKGGLIKAPWWDDVPKKQKPHDHHLIELVRVATSPK
jgi:three-Cys-motif partner protein